MKRKMNDGNKVCIIGCGLIADYHTEAIRQVDGLEVIGYFDADPARAEKMALKTGTKAFRSLEEIWASETDAVSICTPSGTHGPLAVEAMRNGKHAIVEKPLALTEADLNEILEVEHVSGKICAPISQHRFSQGVLAAKRILDEKQLGRIIGVSTTIRYHRDPEYYSSSPWKGTVAMDGGVLMNQGIHALDVMCLLNGWPDQVQGMCGTLHHCIEAEDTAAAVMRFPDGHFGTVIATTAASSGKPWRMEIFGTEGSLTLEEDVLTLVNDVPQTEANRAGGFDRPDGIPVTEHVLQLKNISDALQSKAPLSYTAEDAAKTVRLILIITEGRKKQ